MPNPSPSFSRSGVPSFLVAASLFSTLTLPARAGVGTWTAVGPEGGSVTVLAASPSDPRVVYAGTERSGVFRSGDGGRTWRSASQGLAAAGSFPPLATLEVDPRRPSRVYAGTRGYGAYRSQDGGATWARTGLPAAGPGATVRALFAEPRVADVLYAGTTQGVLRSRDGGRTWTPRSAGLPASEVLALGADPAGGYLYAGLQNGGVYRSADQGGRWEKANAGLPSSVQTLGFDPRSPSVVFAGTANGLFRSLDRGRRWSRVGAGVIVRFVAAVGFQGSTDTAYAASRDGAFVSPNRGATWSPVEGALPVPQLISFAIGPEALFAGSIEDRRGGGIARSVDGGATWRAANRGFSTLSPQEMAFHPTDPDTLYVSAGSPGLFKSIEGGANWSPLPLGPANPAITAEGLAVEPTRPDTVYASSSSILGLLRSDDAGSTWSYAGPQGGGTAMTVLRPDPRTPGGLWSGGFGTAFHTPDGGATWERVVLPEGFLWIFDIEVDPANPAVVTYAGARITGSRSPVQNPVLYRSENGGATWSPIATDTLPDGAVVSFATDRTSPGTLYAATYSGLYRTADGGATWKELLAFNYREGDILATGEAIYASRGPSVLRSTDRGETWTAIRNGLGARPVARLWADPHDPRHLFAGTANAGLYEYTLPAAP